MAGIGLTFASNFFWRENWQTSWSCFYLYLPPSRTELVRWTGPLRPNQLWREVSMNIKASLTICSSIQFVPKNSHSQVSLVGSCLNSYIYLSSFSFFFLLFTPSIPFHLIPIPIKLLTINWKTIQNSMSWAELSWTRAMRNGTAEPPFLFSFIHSFFHTEEEYWWAFATVYLGWWMNSINIK